jgi:hypothetical protein
MTPTLRGRGLRWRPGLDLVNLGLLLLGAIVVKVLWEDGTLQSWLPTEWRSGLRWGVAGLLALLFILDVVGGFDDLVEGLRRSEKSRPREPPDRGSGGAAA